MNADVKHDVTEAEAHTDIVPASPAVAKVHSWRPPCSCGIELKEAIRQAKVHSWRPPCSCGVSLAEIVA